MTDRLAFSASVQVRAAAAGGFALVSDLNEGASMSLVNPHGRDKRLKPLLLGGQECEEAKSRAQGLPRLLISSRETSDLIMLGIGAFTPLEGFMGRADWQGVCDEYRLADGTFWPIPITLSTTREEAGTVKEGQEVALVDSESGGLMGVLGVRERYAIDRAHECKQVF